VTPRPFIYAGKRRGFEREREREAPREATLGEGDRETGRCEQISCVVIRAQGILRQVTINDKLLDVETEINA
jgi:hypothetical protein